MGLLQQRIQFYRSMGTLERAGVQVVRALRQSHPQPFRRLAASMAVAIEQGDGGLGDVMQRFPRHFSPFEVSLVLVGQRTGLLDEVFESLADWFELLLNLRRRIVSEMMYPVLLFHMAAVLIPFISVFTQGTSIQSAAFRALVTIAVPWLVLITFLWLPGTRNADSPFGRALDGVILAVPVVGGLSRRLNYAMYFRAFGLALNAGLGAAAATRLAANTCTNRELAHRFHEVAADLEQEGCTFTEAFNHRSTGSGPDGLVATLLETGEASGSLAESATRTGRMFWEEAEQRLRLLAATIPKIFYFGVMLYVAYFIVSFWQNMFSQTNQFLNF